MKASTQKWQEGIGVALTNEQLPRAERCAAPYTGCRVSVGPVLFPPDLPNVDVALMWNAACDV